MKKVVSVALIIVMCLGCLCGCGNQQGTAGGSGVRIYLSLSEPDTFQCIGGFCTETAEQYGATVDVHDAENSIENQVAHIKRRGRRV